jgi:hypothetical protein
LLADAEHLLIGVAIELQHTLRPQQQGHDQSIQPCRSAAYRVYLYRAMKLVQNEAWNFCETLHIFRAKLLWLPPLHYQGASNLAFHFLAGMSSLMECAVEEHTRHRCKHLLDACLGKWWNVSAVLSGVEADAE